MCTFMTATHLSCTHLHQWLARCFLARTLGMEICAQQDIQTWRYIEMFACPGCRDKRRVEASLMSLRSWGKALKADEGGGM